MDRIDAMAMLIAAVEKGALAGAARWLARSPASITRGVALVEEYAGGRLLHRSTRSVVLTELGREQIATFRHVLDCLSHGRSFAGLRMNLKHQRALPSWTSNHGA
jgi:DNA-binding transcriptional LysR family regulator